jgi:sugar/nucleoside kinase (ribokinase family)
VEGRVVLGGPAYYIGTALHYIEVGARIVTSASPTSRYLRRLQWVEVVEVGSGDTVFRIELTNGGRELVLVSTSRLDPESTARVLEGFSRVVISLTMRELDPEFLPRLVTGRDVVVDVQGFVRAAESSGRVVVEHAAVYSVARLLRKARYAVLRGERTEFPRECWEDPVGCADDLGVDLVITDGERPFVVAPRGGRAYVVKPLEGVSGTPIGLGDVFTAVLSYYLLEEGLELIDAALLASVAATLKLRNRHPWFTRYELAVLNPRVRVSRLH